MHIDNFSLFSSIAVFFLYIFKRNKRFLGLRDGKNGKNREERCGTSTCEKL